MRVITVMSVIRVSDPRIEQTKRGREGGTFMTRVSEQAQEQPQQLAHEEVDGSVCLLRKDSWLLGSSSMDMAVMASVWVLLLLEVSVCAVLWTGVSLGGRWSGWCVCGV